MRTEGAEVDEGEAIPATTQVAKRVAEESVLAHVAARLREIERSTGLERTLAVGELILNKFFGGNPVVWRDRRRNKNNSIRRLAERPDCPYGKSALNEAVGVFVSTRALPCVRTFGHISSSHVAAVLVLPQKDREPMLRKAEDGRWSVRQLKREVVQLHRREGERRGRPALRQPERALASLGSRVRELERAIDTLLECSSTIAPRDVRQVLSLLQLQIAKLELCARGDAATPDVRTQAAEPVARPGPRNAPGCAPSRDLAG